jgi:hypothetical protein
MATSYVAICYENYSWLRKELIHKEILCSQQAHDLPYFVNVYCSYNQRTQDASGRATLSQV